MNLKLRKLFPALLMIFVIGFSGCGQKTKEAEEETLYEKIQSSLSTLNTYETEATVRYISNNGSQAYRTKQYAKTTGEYRIEVIDPEEVKGNITIFDGKVICQYNENILGKVAIGKNESSERSEILLTSFIHNYFEKEEETVSVASLTPNDNVTVLDAKIVGTHPYISTEKLWIDNETLKPIQLIVFDSEGNERIVVTYHNIEYNKELDDTLFLIKEQ